MKTETPAPADRITALEAELAKLKGIIARSAMQRLDGAAGAQMFITADDIKDSLAVLYEWQQLG